MVDGRVGLGAGARRRRPRYMEAAPLHSQRRGCCAAAACTHGMQVWHAGMACMLGGLAVAWVADGAGQQQHTQQQYVPRLQVRQQVGAALAGGAAAEDARRVVVGSLVGALRTVVDLVGVRVRVSGQGRGEGWACG